MKTGLELLNTLPKNVVTWLLLRVSLNKLVEKHPSLVHLLLADYPAAYDLSSDQQLLADIIMSAVSGNKRKLLAINRILEKVL